MEEKYDKTKFQEVEIKQEPKEVRVDSYFDGKVLEYIGWKLLSYIITCVTLGIAAPWGKCMLYNYQFSHTVYNGKRLKFEGTGGDLFVNRFKWYFLTIITLGIYGWWVPAKKANWVISHLHFEDEAYNPDESFFEDKGIKLFWLNVLWRFLNIISVGLLIPFTMCMKLRYINRNTVINKKTLVFTGTGLSLLGNYLLWALLTCITFGIYGWWVRIKFYRWEAKNIHIKRVGEVEEKNKDKSIFLIIPIFFVGIILVGLIIALLSSIFSGFSLSSITKYPLAETLNGWKYCEKGYAHSRMSSDPEGFCYKHDYDMTSEECDDENGSMHTDGDKRYCKLVKDPIKEVKSGYKKAKEEYEEKENIINGNTPVTETTSQCPSGWYYFEYYGKCAKDIKATYEECEKQGGMAAEYNDCTIFMN